MPASNHLIVGLGELNDPQRIGMQTVRKWEIPNARGFPKSPIQMRSAYEMHKKDHLSLEIRSLRSEYNCVGLVFGSRRSRIDISHVMRIFEEDGYQQIPFDGAERGDVVLYEDAKEPAHVGLLWNRHPVSNEWHVLSAWGADGEYFHHLRDLRADWLHRVTIWTDRPR